MTRWRGSAVERNGGFEICDKLEFDRSLDQ